ncbi:uncharacterized protein LOC142521130 isoform X1 [Primulina tabacum]|uniref:uncharacterized protein LOC142521130 isoform X1 n=1 Tax=Primulina tabacum TaxID=48773 RepID=UPI003F5902DA
MNLLKLKLQFRHHDHFHCFRHCHQLIKLAPDARHLFFPTREPKLKQLVSFAAPYDFFSGGSRYVNDVNPFSIDKNGEEVEEFDEYLAEDGKVYQKTLRLVECAMFAAISGLAFLLSNSLAIERYFGCFFALPIVLSTMRWGVAAGRKTMVATAVLLFVLSGPVKAITYLLLHGFLGFTMGTIWRLKASWGTSVVLCSMVRAVGALVNVLIASYLIRENILALITINVHALFTYIFSSMGIISVPSMNLIYFIFGVLLLLNCGSFVFLLHLLYAVFFTRLGMKTSLRLPKWLEAAI